MTRTGWCVALALLASMPAFAAEREKPRIEVVFVLDTTGSMGGLIQGAKDKIWAIANTLVATKPAPDIKMGLVGYRDRGDAYVTRLTDLTDDLDAVYTNLMAFKAEGGGDGPESVNQALHEAVTKIKWSTDDKTYRVIFLVGDYPPHMDYKDDVKYPVTCELAAKAGIIINAIQCGNHAPTEPIWADIAKRAEGQYFRVEQSGGAILASTPFDADLAKLSKELDATRVYYGAADVRKREEGRAKLADAIYDDAKPAAVAQRAEFNAAEGGIRNFVGKQELVEAVRNGDVKLADLKDEELPEAMQKMTAEEREAFIEKNLATRKELQAKIQGLAKKRQEHIRAEIEKQKLDENKSFDGGLYEAIKSQAGKKNIEYKGEQKH